MSSKKSFLKTGEIPLAGSTIQRDGSRIREWAEKPFPSFRLTREVIGGGGMMAAAGLPSAKNLTRRASGSGWF